MVCVCVQNKAPDTMKKASHNEHTHDIIYGILYIYVIIDTLSSYMKLGIFYGVQILQPQPRLGDAA